jgi:hypothetical protein
MIMVPELMQEWMEKTAYILGTLGGYWPFGRTEEALKKENERLRLENERLSLSRQGTHAHHSLGGSREPTPEPPTNANPTHRPVLKSVREMKGDAKP